MASACNVASQRGDQEELYKLGVRHSLPQRFNHHRPVPLNLWWRETKNVGDRFCGTGLHLPLNSEPSHLPQPAERIKGRIVIIGGGGLLYPSLAAHIQRIVEAKPAKLILWGIGTNTHGVETADYPDWFSDCDLIGLRDWNTPYHWAPCASCISPLFDSSPSPTCPIVAYWHFEQTSPPIPSGIPVMHNNVQTMAEAVIFLSSGETVLTNSYHGVYWATLLERKVVAKPFSSRFHHFKHAPTLLNEKESWEDAARRAVKYEMALSECRKSTRKFYEIFQGFSKTTETTTDP